jgi:hypothetical protein
MSDVSRCCIERLLLAPIALPAIRERPELLRPIVVVVGGCDRVPDEDPLGALQPCDLCLAAASRDQAD